MYVCGVCVFVFVLVCVIRCRCVLCGLKPLHVERQSNCVKEGKREIRRDVVGNRHDRLRPQRSAKLRSTSRTPARIRQCRGRGDLR